MDNIYTKGIPISIKSSFQAEKVDYTLLFFSLLLLNLPLIPQTKNRLTFDYFLRKGGLQLKHFKHTPIQTKNPTDLELDANRHFYFTNIAHHGKNELIIFKSIPDF